MRRVEGDVGVEVVGGGGGDAWVRVSGGDSRELHHGDLGGRKLGIFGGCEGGGIGFEVETQDGVGLPFGIESGFSLEIEVGRLVTEGLVDGLMEIHAFHRCGRRTSTGIELNAAGDGLQVIQQI